MTVTGYGGLLGHGKTLGLVFYTYFDHLKGIKVYSNFKVSYAEMVDPMDLLHFNKDLTDGILLLDELGTLFDSRVSGSRASRLLSYFLLQSRKKRLTIRYTSQLLGIVDKRGRDITDYRILCRVFPNPKKPQIFVYSMYQYGIKIGGSDAILPEIKARKFYDMYDDEEVIIPLALNLDVINKDELLEDFEASPNKKSFTALIRNTYPQLLIESVNACYDFLKRGDRERAFRVLTF